MRYCRLLPDRDFQRWFPSIDLPDRGETAVPWSLKRCESFVDGRIVLSTDEAGERFPVSFGELEIPVLDAVARGVFEQFGSNVDLLAAECDNGDAWVLHVRSLVDGIDREMTRGTLWTVNDFRADKAGQYRDVIELVLRDLGDGAPDVFRLVDWLGPIVVSERVVDALRGAGCERGVRLVELRQTNA